MANSLTGYIDRFRDVPLVVVGDVMLDEFLRGDVRRISPEAPVPVLEVRSRDQRLGGAANTAANIQALGGRATVIGLVGDDPAGDTVRRLLREAGLGTSVVTEPGRPTTCKTRLVARGQQMVRADSESVKPPGLAALAALRQAITEAIATAKGVVLSDYAKGVVSAELASHAVSEARKRNLPVVVDPKQRDFAVYAGATVVTPNTSELELAVGRALQGDAEVLAAAAELLPKLGGAAILATRGAEGMTLIRTGEASLSARATAKTVFDVTGAGDTVVATLALSLATAVPWHDAMRLASAAAGIVVSKQGTATVSPAELTEASSEV